MRDQPSFFHINYIFHNQVCGKSEELSTMSALVVMIRFRYISPHPSTSIDSENNSKNSPHFLDINEATRNAMANVRKSTQMPQVLELTSIKQSKIIKEKFYIEEFFLYGKNLEFLN